MNDQQTEDSCADCRLDEICDRFETAWRNGLQPRIENYVEGVQGPARSRLLRALVALEVAARRQAGEHPVCADYRLRFCSDISTVCDGFDSGCSVDSAERTVRMDSGADVPASHLDIHCPNCHAQMHVAADTQLTEVTCTTCGIRISLADHTCTRTAPPLSHLGRFELIERLGVGGFGTVWKARDKELDRTVAIKIPRQGTTSEQDQARFFHEARAAAQLHHPNIVSVYEVGREGDSIYIVSDYIRGVTLDDWLSRRPLTARETAELCGKIANALHHAHKAGVVHRDLKPANIMIDGEGEPHLMDFGLARRDVGDRMQAQDGQVIGTPAYMSPEQAQGNVHQTDRRSDLYSLGVILFRLLTGELPFRGNCRMMLHQVIHDDPPSLRKLNGQVPKDLETVTLKCLEKAPASRYPTAHELECELLRFLAGEPIRARAAGPMMKVAKWAKRKPMVAIVTAMIIGLAIVGPLVAIRQSQLLRERDAALRAEKFARAEAVTQRNAAQAALAKVEQAHRQTEDLTAFALAVLETPTRLDLGRDSTDLSVAELFQQSAERVRVQFADQPSVAARLVLAVASSLRDLGQYQEAEQLSRESLAISEQVSGPDSEATLMAGRLLASCLHKQGRRAVARDLLLDYASRAETALGESHPAHLLLCTDLAFLYAENYQQQAIEWIQKVVPHYATAFAEQHPDRRFITNRAGWVYCMLGQYETGLKLFEETLELRRKYDGRLDHATLRVQHANVAWALTSLGRHEEAIRNQLEALALFRERYPQKPDRWLWPQAYLVYRYCRAERFEEALSASADFLNTCRLSGQNLEDNYGWTLWDLHDVLYRKGFHEQAETLAEQMVGCLRDVRGEDDLAVYRAALRHLRTARRYQQMQNEIEAVVDKVWNRFQSCRQLLGNQHQDVARTVDVFMIGLSMLPEANPDYTRGLKTWFRAITSGESSDVSLAYQAAMAALAQQNETEHRRLCSEMLEQMRSDDHRESAEQVCYVCVAVPDSTSNRAELMRLATLAEQPRLMGAVLYRAGEFEASLASFDEAANTGHKFNSWDLAFRAMALHRLGRAAEARQALSDARHLSLHFPSSWQEDVAAALLLQEADALLDASVPARRVP